MNEHYNEFISRNYMYISEELQEKIKNTKLVFFGAGLCSMIAEHCARLGFMKMHLIDGDKVELSNLNRQAFTTFDRGTHKSTTIRSRILAINPLCDITISTDYINDLSECTEQINLCDIVINTIDCNATYFDIIDYARAKNKLVICPFNPGFSGLAIIFNKQSIAADEMFDLTDKKKLNDLEIAKQIFNQYPEINTMEQVDKSIDLFLQQVVEKGHFPQITIGALLSTAIVLTTLIRFLNKEPIELAPQIAYLNYYKTQKNQLLPAEKEFVLSF